MIQHPAILALTIASLMTGLMLIYAGWYGTWILDKWDLHSGSELQLNLERRTYLISVILSYALLFQIASLFLYIFTADNLHSQFTGAMCAAGSLGVNSFGYPVLILKILNCLLAGVWLIINHVDTRGYDYPLIKAKYGLLNVLVPLVLLEVVFQFVYFFNLKADVITSCCGSLFSTDKHSIAGEIAGLPSGPMQAAFFGIMAATVVCGMVFFLKKRGGYLFAALSALTFLVSSAALVSFICLYFYELPSHHCPFCILQKEYHYIGYALYATLLGGTVSGLGVGVLMPFSTCSSLSGVIPNIQRRLAATTLIMYLLFTLIVVWRMLSTSFTLG
ncbi:MAG: hypothetical protein JJE30_10140 [Desulfuromonadales bacterium]|nr:hypothetical protein [Desulfuromonadales bacterium]